MFEEDTSAPPPPDPLPASAASKKALTILAVVLAVLAIGGFLWARSSQQQLTAQVDALNQLTTRQTQDIQVLRQRLHLSSAELDRLRAANADVRNSVQSTQQQLATTQQQMARQGQAAANAIAQVQQDTGSKLGALNGQLTGVKGNVSTNHQQIVETQANLAKARAQLKSAMGDLGMQGGLIATTRDQLGVLERAGQRNYYSFNLDKTKQPVHVGPIEIRVTHIDTRHQRYNLDVYADDAKIEKKNRTLDEPVQLLIGSHRELVQIVVYRIEKHLITGYLETPKYPGQS